MFASPMIWRILAPGQDGRGSNSMVSSPATPITA